MKRDATCAPFPFSDEEKVLRAGKKCVIIDKGIDPSGGIFYEL
jgi:hypothetical protein